MLFSCEHIRIETDDVGIESPGRILKSLKEGRLIIYLAHCSPDLTGFRIPAHALT